MYDSEPAAVKNTRYERTIVAMKLCNLKANICTNFSDVLWCGHTSAEYAWLPAYRHVELAVRMHWKVGSFIASGHIFQRLFLLFQVLRSSWQQLCSDNDRGGCCWQSICESDRFRRYLPLYLLAFNLHSRRRKSYEIWLALVHSPQRSTDTSALFCFPISG